jgi:hypothetical protein
MFKAIFGGRGGYNSAEMPQHIQEIDHIVCTSPRDIRIILIKFYGSTGTFQDKAIALGLNRLELRRRVERADYYANSRLDGFTEQVVDLCQRENSRSNLPDSVSG